MTGNKEIGMTDTKRENKTTTESTKVERTRQRGAFNGTRGKLQVGKSIPGFHLHIFNDTPGRIQASLDTGYEFVHPEEVGGVTENVTSRNTDLGDKVRFLVGSQDGEPQYAYLMKIREDWWLEDQKELQIRNDKTDAAIRGGKLTGDGMTSEGFYNAGIKFNP
jgi:hypothetical protein